MSQSVIMVDSGADLPRSYIERHGLAFLPLSYTFGGKSYVDDMGDSLPYPEFYQMIRDGQMPKTSQPVPEQVIDVMKPKLEKGVDILYLAFSSTLSGTCHNAMVACEGLRREFPDRRILIVDTLAASLGQGLLVDYAVQMLEDGTDIEQIATWVENNKQTLQHWFTVDDINHLFRGGRVSRAAAFAGTLLLIKPVLHMDSEGRLIPINKVRGRRRALRELVDRMAGTGLDLAGQRVFISHADALEDAEYVAEMIRERFGVTDIMISYIGAVIGTHTGPGVIALFFKGKRRQDFNGKGE